MASVSVIDESLLVDYRDICLDVPGLLVYVYFHKHNQRWITLRHPCVIYTSSADMETQGIRGMQLHKCSFNILHILNRSYVLERFKLRNVETRRIVQPVS